jgi:hypothetical protein
MNSIALQIGQIGRATESLHPTRFLTTALADASDASPNG